MTAITGSYHSIKGASTLKALPHNSPVRLAREAKARKFLLDNGHRDIAIILGLVPGGAQS